MMVWRHVAGMAGGAAPSCTGAGARREQRCELRSRHTFTPLLCAATRAHASPSGGGTEAAREILYHTHTGCSPTLHPNTTFGLATLPRARPASLRPAARRRRERKWTLSPPPPPACRVELERLSQAAPAVPAALEVANVLGLRPRRPQRVLGPGAGRTRRRRRGRPRRQPAARRWRELALVKLDRVRSREHLPHQVGEPAHGAACPLAAPTKWHASAGAATLMSIGSSSGRRGATPWPSGRTAASRDATSAPSLAGGARAVRRATGRRRGRKAPAARKRWPRTMSSAVAAAVGAASASRGHPARRAAGRRQGKRRPGAGGVRSSVLSSTQSSRLHTGPPPRHLRLGREVAEGGDDVARETTPRTPRPAGCHRRG